MKNIGKYAILGLVTLTAALLSACTTGTPEDSKFTPLNPDLSLLGGPTGVVPSMGTTEGQEFKLQVKSNLPWRVKSGADWISLGKTENGLGDGEVTFAVARNKSTTPRVGKITAWITNDYSKTLVVTQSGREASEPVIHYVTTGGSGDGFTWATATSLDKALENAVDGDAIQIAAGTYAPTHYLGGVTGSPSDRSFEIAANIEITGGYPEGATEGSTPDPKVNTTILSGKQIDGAISNHVVCIVAPKAKGLQVKLSGLTITGGSTPGSGTGSISLNGAALYRFYGGGLINGNSNATIENCIISENKSVDYAAGFYNCDGAVTHLEGCTIDSNRGGNGAAIFNSDATLYINNSSVTNNVAKGVGCALYSHHAVGQGKPSYSYVTNTLFAKNSSSGKHGSVYGRECSETLLLNCTIIGGESGGDGGGVDVYGTTARPTKMTIIGCTITGNTCQDSGGGICITKNVTLDVANTIVSGNFAPVKPKYADMYIAGASDLPNSFAYSIVGSSIYDAATKLVAGKTFDVATMLGEIQGSVCPLKGVDNPARKLGISSTELTALATTFSSVLDSKFFLQDQLGQSRADKTVIGACVKE